VWYIAVVAVFIDFGLPLHSAYLAEYFSTEASCVEYLNKNSDFLYKSVTEEFPQYENEGNSYNLESITLSCKYYSPLIDA
tara:strand:+ start:7635 stop:7874 length:240 start_codon:yes stop_codon:yes gene_type:complete